jgi:ABC-type nitrate/sulfonate/bicarbonate transport system permease component
VTRALLVRIRGPLLGITGFLAALTAWELWTMRNDSFYVPRATEVVGAAWNLWRDPEFLSTAAESLERLAAGFLIGSAIGVGLGLLMGSSLRARSALGPLVELLRSTPPIAIVPALLIVLGLGNEMRVTVIAFGVCFPVLLNTVDGVRAVSPEARDTASMLHVGRLGRTFRIYLPAALPSIAAGLRIAVSVALVLVVVSELAGEGGGLGGYLEIVAGRSEFPELYAAILFLGLLGYVLNRLFLAAERRALAWHYGAIGEQPA